MLHKKILILVNRDFVLYNFRFELLERLIGEGYEVYICLPYGPKVDMMTEIGCHFTPIEIDKRGTNPLKDLKLIADYRRIFGEVKPDVILMYTTKVCIYAGTVAGKMGIPYLLNVSGLGTALEQPSLIQPLMIKLYKMACRKAGCVFYQNEDNISFFHKHNIFCDEGRECLIPGSGVNIKKWKYLDYPLEDNGIVFLFVARIIKEKGIEEFLKCAESVRAKYPNAFFNVVGPCDGDYKSMLEDFENRGIVKYYGETQDTAAYIKNAHCLIHPSYYPEGVSNVCLEAAASGRPVITTDNLGCMKTVDNGITGYIFPAKDLSALIYDVEIFINTSFENKCAMGKKARQKMMNEFDREIVLDAYEEKITKLIDVQGLQPISINY